MMDGSVAQLPADLSAVRSTVLAWFDEHHRPFPWRERDDPWELLVLEVMSQQTQLDRVTDPWTAFIERWPTPAALADASRGDVIDFWSAHRLGYNRRATYLHEAATQIVDTHDGEVPSSVQTLETLPGIGPYTANAVSSFAFDRGGPVIDTNVKRILYRAFDVPDESRAYEAVATELAPAGKIGDWNAAIMELGGVACTKQPRCDEAACPLRRHCRAYLTGEFTAPDVPSQSAYEGSRRQYRGRVIEVLRGEGCIDIDDLGHAIRVEYDPAGTVGREWLRELLGDMEDDGLVVVHAEDLTVSLPS